MPEPLPTLPLPLPAPVPAGETLAEGGTTPPPHDPNRTTAYVANDTTVSFPVIPGYQIEQELGRGGMGVVYRARQVGLDRTVALKMILRADFASAEQKLRFQIEAENAARVQNPNIVQVHEIGEHQGQPYFALEFVEGGSLADWLNSHRATPAEAALLVETLAYAMHAAHSQGIIHRDLKPANVLLGEPSASAGGLQPKITDFGLAKRLDATDHLTGSGAIMGTPSYMAPEQARGDTKHVGPAADQYALGVIFYQLLTQRLPFVGSHAADLFDKIANEEAVAPRIRNALIPADLSIICLKCLEKDPAKRYATTEALAEDLKNWREHRPIAARPATRVERVTKWCRRYPAVAALIVVSLLAAGVASGLAWWAVIAERAAVAERDAKEVALEKEQTARKSAETNLDYARKGNELLASVFVDLDPNANHVTLGEFSQALRDNLKNAVRELEGTAIGDPLTVAAMQVRLGRALLGLGDPQQASMLFERARTTRRNLLGPDHADTLVVTNNLAFSYQASGRISLAVPLYEETLRTQKAKIGSDHPHTLISMQNLAEAYRAAGKIDQALPIFEESLKLHRSKHDAEHESTLKFMHNLAKGYLSIGKIDRALPLFEESLAMMKVQFGPDHPDTLVGMANLAAAYHEARKHEQALPLFEDTLRLTRAKLGRNHPHTLSCMNGLAGVYFAAGKPDLALPLIEEVLKLMRAKLGLEHPDTLNAMNNLAFGYQAAGKLDLALPLYEEALKLETSTLGPDHPYTLNTAYNLAHCYQAAGNLGAALPLYEETLKHRKSKLGADHPDTINTMKNLAHGYKAAKKLDLALPLYEATLQLQKSTLGPDTLDTINTMYHLAFGYYSAKKFDLALPLFEETLKLQKSKLGPDHFDTLTTMNNLALSYQSARRLDLALPLYEETLKLSKSKLGPDHPRTLTNMNNLAFGYQAAGKLDLAVPLYEEALKLQKSKLGSNHPNTLTTMNNLARAYLTAGRSDKAAQLKEEVFRLRLPPRPPAR